MGSMALLILMNIGVMASIYLTIFLVEIFFGIKLDSSSTSSLLILSVIVGFSGSLISLFLSKSMAKRQMGVEVITSPQSEQEVWLVDTVKELAQKAGIRMPEVGIFNGAPNAFATGASRNSALVAVSSAMFDIMSKDELKGVLAHEIGHIKSGDMITMTLLQGVLNTFVFFFSRLIANIVAPKDENGNRSTLAYYGISFVLEMVLTLFASMVAMWFSRYREYKADATAVRLSGPQGIYDALSNLAKLPKDAVALPNDAKAFGIVGFMGDLFRTHPPMQSRLDNIEKVALELGYRA
jgi:heat shock protein HtpX